MTGPADLPTPRTDAARAEASLHSGVETIIDTLVECARGLEQELAAERAGLMDAETLRFAPSCLAQLACRVLWLREKTQGKNPDPRLATPELRALLAPFVAPLPDEKNLLSSNQGILHEAIRHAGQMDYVTTLCAEISALKEARETDRLRHTEASITWAANKEALHARIDRLTGALETLKYEDITMEFDGGPDMHISEFIRQTLTPPAPCPPNLFN